MTKQPSKLDIGKSEYIAYHKIKGKENKPGIIFLGGFMSDMEGTKALALQEFCQKNNLSFIRFDYFGHGSSSKKFTECTIGMWKQNALDVIDNLTQGQQILIGSSMGGWLMLLVTLARKTRIHALIGIASAPDFTKNLIWDKLSNKEKQQLKKTGLINLASEYTAEPYPITSNLIEEGRNHLLLNNNINIHCPVRLLHGMKDDDVPFSLSIELAKKLISNDIRIYLNKSSDHRMSANEDINTLCSILNEVIHSY